MTRAFSWVVLVAAVFALAGPEVQAQPYLKGPASTINQFTTRTALGPNPRTRTTIGIGEQVACTLDPTTWADTDINIANPEAPVNVADTMGIPTWAANGNGVVFPLMGNTTTLTGFFSPGNVTVTASIPDSGTRGIDPVINQSVAFVVVAPSNAQAYSQADNTAGWTAWPPNNRVGQNTIFGTQVTPLTVNFSRVSFRENRAQQTFTWPNGTNFTYPALQNPYTVTEDGAGNFNTVPCISSTGLDPRAVLTLPPNFIGPPAPTYTYTLQVPNEYFNAAGLWNQPPFVTEGRRKVYDTTTLTCKGGFIANTILWGNQQGPWQ
jgi:hypothetical protein